MASTRLGAVVLEVLEAAGIPACRLLGPLGLPEGVLRDREARIPVELLNDLWSRATALTGDRDIGIRAVLHMTVDEVGVLGYAMRSSENLGAAIRTGLRYQRVLHEATADALRIDGDQAVVVVTARTGSPIVPVLAEFALGGFVVLARLLLDQPGSPTEVRFAHPEPDDTRAHRELFACPLRWQQEENAIVFPTSLLDMPLPESDPGLFSVLDRHIQLILERIPDSQSFAQRVAELIAGDLRGGAPSLEATAERLQLSARTLRRRLTDEGTTYRELLDSLRHQIALRYLDQPEFPPAEVSFLLGFSDPKAFDRAFKRWTGQTPAAYRARPRS